MVLTLKFSCCLSKDGAIVSDETHSNKRDHADGITSVEQIDQAEHGSRVISVFKILKQLMNQ